jgi:hypothetical protein
LAELTEDHPHDEDDATAVEEHDEEGDADE